jgi:WW domain-containing oxidoreductase
MSLYSMFKGTGESGFGYGSSADDVVEELDISGKSVLVTGFNSGIGKQCARALAEAGATVLGAARTREKAERTIDDLSGNFVPVVCELSEPESVLGAVETATEYGEPLDAIICNAGIMALPELELQYGYEKQFFVNHVGHFILVTNLGDQLAEDGRVVMVSSEAHKNAPREGVQLDNLDGSKGYGPWKAYGQSKFANLLFAKEMARRFDDTDRVSNAVHPGVIDTNLTRHMNVFARVAWTMLGPLFLKSESEGAATQTWAAVHPDAGEINGEYFVDCNIDEPRAKAEDPELARRLWERTEEIVAEVT